MNATKTSENSNTLSIVICLTFPVLLLLFICCIICITAERRKPPVRAVVVVPVILEAELVHTKVVPPLPEI